MPLPTPLPILDARGRYLRTGVAVSRASTKNVFNPAGALVSVAANTPAWDCDPATGAERGLLVERASTNVLLNSATLATQSVTVSATAYTLSFYGTGSVALSGAHTATVAGSGAYPTRTTLTFTPSAGTLTLTVSGTVQYAQLEAGSRATSYIPTTGSTASRLADAITLALDNWFNTTEGSAIIEATAPYYSSDLPFLMSATDGATTNNVSVYLNATNAVGEVRAGGAAQAVITRAHNSATTIKIGMAWKSNDVALTVAGGAVDTDTSATMPTGMTTLHIGSRNGSLHADCTIRRITLYPRRLSNADLQAMTA